MMKPTQAGPWPTELWRLADLVTPMAIRVAATLRIADHIADGNITLSALATRTGALENSLERLLNHLTAIGLLIENSPGEFNLTSHGTLLQQNGPGGLQRWLDIEGAVGRADLSLVRLLDAVRTGQPVYPATYGRGFWEDLASEPGLSASFDDLMSRNSAMETPALLSGYPWTEVTHVMDIGGGTGTMLIELLYAHPRLRGTLVDLPATAAAAGDRLEAAGLADRCRIAPQSFFDALPPGADVYLLSGVIHDWADAHAIAILRRCAEAARPDGTVLVAEGVLDMATEPASITTMDLRMLAYFGGRQRTLEQFSELAAAAGLALTKTTSFLPDRALLHLIPAVSGNKR
jgi:SAM-dependent methyltransferase